MLPSIFRTLGLEKGIFHYINQFSYFEFLKASTLYQHFQAYNVFGYPVLYPTLLFIVFTFVTITFVFLIYNRFSRQQINT